jgi:hypothetical protein
MAMPSLSGEINKWAYYKMGNLENINKILATEGTDFTEFLLTWCT